jgi:hypothetical protein
MAVATPELIGVLAWWAVVLAVPLVLLRRLRRRRRARERAGATAFPVDANTIWPSGTCGVSAAISGGESGGEASVSGHGASVRLSPGTLEPLCRYVDFRRRLELAAAELERRLAVLPRARWRVEPYPLTGERRNTLLVLGQTGLFVISATYAPGHWDDVVAVSRLAGKIQLLLPGYAGRVQPAICHPFSSLRPRVWHRADDQGNWVAAWLIGGDSLIEWIEHFGSEHGVGPGDLGRFDELAKPNWLKPAVPAAPSWPPLPDRASSGPQG